MLTRGLLPLLVLLGLLVGSGPAAAAEFHSCASQKLENQGVFKLRASHAKCRLARQVAFARRGGDETPKGFGCTTGAGGNLTPFSCARGTKLVRFQLEG